MPLSLSRVIHDLITPDGSITKLTKINDTTSEAIVSIQDIPADFVGFQIDSKDVFFNLKSTLAQLGLDAVGQEYELNAANRFANIRIKITAYGAVGVEMLKHLQVGAVIGKLFAADERRRVRDPEYISRMFGRCDRWGAPLLSLGGLQGGNDLILDKVDGRTVAYLTLQTGRVEYDPGIFNFLPTLAKALCANMPMRDMLRLHQQWKPNAPRSVTPGEILLARTLPLHIRTVFGRVVPELLAHGYQHTTASILQPDTNASGNIYELYGDSKKELTDIPLEFYTLEPYREHVFFSDRDQLQASLEDSETLFKAFETAPLPIGHHAVFVVKGHQLLELTPQDWVSRDTHLHEFPGAGHGTRQALMIERYIQQQPQYPFLKQIDDGLITSQGVLLSMFFPSPLMKRMLLSNQVQRLLKGIYFQHPSYTHRNFFSHEDHALLHDLYKFAIPVYWVDQISGEILQFVEKPNRDSGMFIPLQKVETFLKSTVFGTYGSNLLEGNFETELRKLLQGILDLRETVSHPLLKKGTPLSLVTGGGPGAMEVGNRVASELGILSCANLIHFGGSEINEQKQNPYIEAKMTYSLDRLVERQAEFNLDFPIFLNGGIGTDFEFCLEEVRRKVGATPATPMMLFGSIEYWKEKITPRFRCNLKAGTIKGSEWLSNCYYAIQTAEQGLKIYSQYFNGTLPIGKNGPIHEDGFVTVE